MSDTAARPLHWPVWQRFRGACSILQSSHRAGHLGGGVAADAVIKACAVRAQPIVLTALAAMAGAFFIIDDPTFSA